MPPYVTAAEATASGRPRAGGALTVGFLLSFSVASISPPPPWAGWRLQKDTVCREGITDSPEIEPRAWGLGIRAPLKAVPPLTLG